jgi:STE24 endopeptidase
MNEDKAARYHRLRRRAVVGAAVWTALLLSGLLLTRGSHAIRDAGETVASLLPSYLLALRTPVTAAFWALAVALLHELGTMPFAAYGGFVLDRRYGLSRQSAGEWLRDHVKALGLGLLLAAAGGAVVSSALAVWPDRWWMAVWAIAAAVGVALTWAAPVYLLPLFFKLTPLQNDNLRTRLLALAARLGAPALGIFEWRLSDRTSRANAMLTGVGSTRRILVSDTLVTDYEADEVEVILAHELAHHLRFDVWRGLLVECAVAGLACWAASRVLPVAAPVFGLHGEGDVAGLPVLILTAMAVSLVLLPLTNALSRMAERRADRFALDATTNSEAFIRAMRRLGALNLAEDAPSRLVRLFFYTHPPLGERIALARAWTSRYRAAQRG